MRLNKKNIVVLLISVSILLSMSSCNYRGRASGVWESSDSVAAEECMRKEPKKRLTPKVGSMPLLNIIFLSSICSGFSFFVHRKQV